MKKKSLPLSLLFLGLFFTNYSYAATFHAQANGFWQDASTWLEGAVPSVGDDVIIDGYTVTFCEASGDVTINKLNLSNTKGTASGLILTGSRTLEVTTDVLALSTAFNDIALKLADQSVLSVLGSLTFERENGSSSGEEVYLNIAGQSRLTVGGEFNFNYDDASLSELMYEIKIENDGKLFVLGNMNLMGRGGHSFEMNIWNNGELTVNGNLVIEMLGGENMDVDLYEVGTKIQINGDLNLVNHAGQGGLLFGESSSDGKVTINGNANIESKGVYYKTSLRSAGVSASLEIKKDINLKAVSDASTTVKVGNNASLKLGGTINRDGNGYGVLKMDETSMLELNGTGPQVVPPSRVLSTAVDSLYISNLKFNNTSGQAITILGVMYVHEHLDLTGGILQTTSKNLLVLGENATIDPGSETSYIDGPIQKIGGTKGLPFVFPTGHGDVYAPIEISAITGSTTFGGATSVYTAEYRRGDPPPFGELAQGIESITENQYWTLNNDGGTEQVSVTLHWSDPASLGITDVASLLVVSYNPTTSTWTNHGKAATSGVVTAADTPGYVMGMEGDPPPFGENLSFTIGSTDIGTLPVELIRFEAVQEVDEVYLQWATASEINASHFIVEHSFDGLTFEPLTSVHCNGGEEMMSTYSAKDAKPYYGSNFYRLKIVDKDDSFEYSEIEVANFELIPVVSLYPNPVTESINLEVGGETYGEGMMEVFDRNGRLIYQGEVSFENGSFQIYSSEMNANTPGTYIIRIVIEQQEQVIKFIKLK